MKYQLDKPVHINDSNHRIENTRKRNSSFIIRLKRYYHRVLSVSFVSCLRTAILNFSFFECLNAVLRQKSKPYKILDIISTTGSDLISFVLKKYIKTLECTYFEKRLLARSNLIQSFTGLTVFLIHQHGKHLFRNLYLLTSAKSHL